MSRRPGSLLLVTTCILFISFARMLHEMCMMCICVFTCVEMGICLPAHVRTCGGAKLLSAVFFTFYTLYLLRQDLFLN